MKINVPPYTVIRTKVSQKEWRFEFSDEESQATLEFDNILEGGKGSGALRKFLKQYPWHFDALTHYAMGKFNERKYLEAYAFSHAAVATGWTAFPPEFDFENHFLPGGFVHNRPFLRSLHNLMICYAALEDYNGAIAVAKKAMKLDYEDRMGCRYELIKYYMIQARHQSAADLFESESFKDTFFIEKYLYAVVLIHLNRQKEAIQVIEECLYRPRIARYLLDPFGPPPEPDSRFGAPSGSELEGYLHAREYFSFWSECDGALALLKKLSKKVEKAGWPAFSSAKSKS